MKCEKCGSETRIMGQCTISAPSSLYGKFSKKNLRSKEVQLVSVNWETFDIICTNPKCGKTTNSYGNYVSSLERQVKELKEQLQVVEEVNNKNLF